MNLKWLCSFYARWRWGYRGGSTKYNMCHTKNYQSAPIKHWVFIGIYLTLANGYPEQIEPRQKIRLFFLLFVANAFSIFATRSTEATGYLIFTLCVVLFPILVLSIVDALRQLRRSNQPSKPLSSIFATLLSLPVLLMGLLAATVGAAIITWVLYNLIVERLPQFTGPSLIISLSSFGLGFPLLFLGWRWIRLAFGVKNS